MMALFEFELKPVAEIAPWGEAPDLSLSWFALTDGQSRINAGSSILFRYTDAILSYWEIAEKDADYPLAAFARDILGCVAPAITPLPKFLHHIADDWTGLRRLQAQSAEHDAHYEAFRWLGERSPWFSYLVENPEISFIREKDNILIEWDNTACLIEGIPVWEAQFGSFTLPVEAFLKECHSFCDRLLDEMYRRINMIEKGEIKAQIPLNTHDLYQQHDTWRDEFQGYFEIRNEPDVPWDEAESALDLILKAFPNTTAG